MTRQKNGMNWRWEWYSSLDAAMARINELGDCAARDKINDTATEWAIQIHKPSER